VLVEVHLTAHAHTYISAHGSMRSIEYNCPPHTALAMNHRACEEDEVCVQKCVNVYTCRDGNLKGVVHFKMKINPCLLTLKPFYALNYFLFLDEYNQS